MEIKKQTLKETWQQDKLSFFLIGGMVAGIIYLSSIVGSEFLSAYGVYAKPRIQQRKEIIALQEQALGRKMNPLEVSLIENIENESKSLARQISLKEYIPVGNGGALSEFYGKVPHERKQMYKLIEERYINLIGNCSGQELKGLLR